MDNKINSENLDTLERWIKNSRESLTHFGLELRTALAIEHLAQAVSRGAAALERIAELKKETS